MVIISINATVLNGSAWIGDQIVNQLISEIESLEAKLFLYYFTPDGHKYNMEELNVKQYEQLHNMLDFTRFQLKNLSQK